MNDDQSTPPVNENEFDRLIELSEMDLDYTELEDFLQDLNTLAAKIANTPISFVNLIDNFTQWTVSNEGFDLHQMPREESVCQFTITEEAEFEIQDLSQDERFKNKFYVKDEPRLKYYYGIPLTTAKGHNIGALCVLDWESRELDPEKKEFLSLVADEVIKRIEFLKENNMLKGQLEKLRKTQKKVGHDIRSSLGGIIGITDMIKSDLDPEKAKDILELVNMIKKGSQSVLDLADEIMKEGSYSKEPGANEFSISTFCEKLENLYMPQARAKEVNLKIMNKADNQNVFFPKTKLIQIAGNIISNSLKFTPENGEVVVTVSMNESDEATHQLEITVKDTGVGMTKEKQKEILSGTQSSEDGTSGEKGYGFGLQLVKHLIDKANGTMKIESEQGKGTTFKVTIPV